MDTETRFKLVSQNLQEIITRDELRNLLETKETPRGYVGFEPSGMMHAGTGLIVGKKMQDYAEAGFHFIIFLADWHGWINNKMGGNMENIRAAGEYFKDCFTALGLPEGKVEYLWTSDLVDDKDYWEKVVRVMKSTSLKRMLRAMPIMGRSADSVDVESAWALYPALQTSDIFQMKLDVAAAGMDQRKVHMLAREVAPKLGYTPPVCLHGPLLPSLQDTSLEGSFDEDENINMTIKGLLQVAVNLYDATTNRALTPYPYLPTVLKPMFRVEGTNLFVAGYREVTNAAFLDRMVIRDVRVPSDRAALAAEPDGVVYDVPFLIGAKKGFPNFNEFSMINVAQVSRKVEVVKRTEADRRPVMTNLVYLLSVSNQFGIEFWNSYTNRGKIWRSYFI